MVSKPENGSRRRRVTVNDVAGRAGVSQATVSQVFAGSRPVSEVTRAKVLQAAEEIGYRPNQLARALRQRRSLSVALIVPNIMHEVYPMAARGVSEVLRPHGYQVAVYDTDNLKSTERQVVSAIADRMVDGAVAFGYALRRSDALMLEDLGIPVVNGGFAEPLRRDWDTVSVGQGEAFQDVVKVLTARHPGPVGYIGGPEDHSTAPVREAGFRAGMDAVGVPIDENLVAVAASYAPTAGRDALNELLRDGLQPRLLICANDLIAIGAMAAARTHGLRIPEDLAVSGYDNIPAAEVATPPLTTVEAFPREQGSACARLLYERITGDYTGPPRNLILNAKLIERESA
jgi:LacI family transcriptional regulator